MHRGRKGSRFSFLNMTNIKDRVAQLYEQVFHGDDNHRCDKLCEWILLDNQSMVNIFCNEDLLGDIKNTNQTMTIDTNGGSIATNQQGYLNNFGYVWYDKRAITNILSLAKVKEKY